MSDRGADLPVAAAQARAVIAALARRGHFGAAPKVIASEAQIPPRRARLILGVLVAAEIAGCGPDLFEGDREPGRPALRFWLRKEVRETHNLETIDRLAGSSSA